MTNVWSRRQVLQTALAAAAAGGMSGTALAQQKKLMVMALGGSWGDAIRDMIGKPFTAQYQAEVGYDQRPNAQQLAALEAMKGNPSVDLVELGGPRLGQAVALGLIDKMDPAAIPNYADVHPKYKNPWYADRYIAPWVLTINTKKIDKARAEAEGWNILLDKKLSGQVAIPKFGWMGEMWMNALNLALGGSYDSLDAAVGFCRKVVRENDGLVMESNDQGMQLFQSGEIVAAPFWTGRTYQMAEAGVPVDFVYPKGWVPYGGGFVLIAGAKEKTLAQKYIDVSLSTDVQVGFAKQFNYLPTTMKAMAAVSAFPKLQIAAADLDRALTMEYDKVYKNSDRNLERFNKEVVG